MIGVAVYSQLLPLYELVLSHARCQECQQGCCEREEVVCDDHVTHSSIIWRGDTNPLTATEVIYRHIHKLQARG